MSRDQKLYRFLNDINQNFFYIVITYSNEFNILLNKEHTLDNIKYHIYTYIVTFEGMKEKLYNI